MIRIVIVIPCKYVLAAGYPHYVLLDQDFKGFCGPILQENNLIVERSFIKSFIITPNHERRDRNT